MSSGFLLHFYIIIGQCKNFRDFSSLLENVELGKFMQPSQVKFEQWRAKLRNISSTWDRDYFANLCLYKIKKSKKIRLAFSMTAVIYIYSNIKYFSHEK